MSYLFTTQRFSSSMARSVLDATVAMKLCGWDQSNRTLNVNFRYKSLSKRRAL